METSEMTEFGNKFQCTIQTASDVKWNPGYQPWGFMGDS